MPFRDALPESPRARAFVPNGLALALTALATLAAGCDDAAKVSEQTAADEVARLLPVVKKDVEQVRNGLPQGAAKLATLIDPDPGANLLGLQQAIAGARASVQDLAFAKSTFFSFADPSGVVLRSEADPDMLASKSVIAAFPALKKALEPTAGLVETFGEMAEMRGVRTGPDHQWVVAHPVKGDDGKLRGLFVTGWSYRRFAYHLEETAKGHLRDRAEREGRSTLPVLYVFALKAGKAYGAMMTPDVNAEAVEKLDLLPKTASGPYRGRVDIAGRTFGIGAARTPELGDDAAVAVLVSEL